MEDNIRKLKMDYKNGKIYRLFDKTTGDGFYIGSTASSLPQRFHAHKTRLKSSPLPVYEKWRSIGTDNVGIELIEDYPCETKNQLHRREGYWIKQNPNFENVFVAGRTVQEHYEDNKERFAEKRRQWYEDNPTYNQDYYQRKKDYIKQLNKEYREQHKEILSEKKKAYREANKEAIQRTQAIYRENHKEEMYVKAKERIICECGLETNRRNIARHKKSQRHLDRMSIK